TGRACGRRSPSRPWQRLRRARLEGEAGARPALVRAPARVPALRQSERNWRFDCIELSWIVTAPQAAHHLAQTVLAHIYSLVEQMSGPKGAFPAELELIVLLALARLGREAY